MTLPRCFGGPFWFTALLAGALGVYLPQARAAEPIAPRDALLHVPLNPQAAQALAPATGIPARLQLPDGSGPFPLVYLHHERRFYTGRHPRYEAAARYFLGRGFAVVTPVRAGYGALDALGDRESLRCRRPDPGRIFASSTLQAAAVLEGLSALGQPIDRQRVLHVGVGVGGFAALSAAALSPQGVLGAVNFGGGAGGNPDLFPGEPCGSAAMERLSRVLGQATEAHRRETGRALPTLWIYADNDRHFGPRHARQWLLAFRRVGGQAALHQLPPWQDDGNRLFADGLARWQPLLDAFLDALPVPAPQVVSRAEPGAGLPGP